jgi:hypothetical protein
MYVLVAAAREFFAVVEGAVEGGLAHLDSDDLILNIDPFVS